ncbi:MAG: hypothetical protein IJQ81_06700 [Oscillibacter sp.]|nr:hypothetical protein [Oscillibacter sp.]
MNEQLPPPVYELEFTAGEIETLCAGLGALSKRIRDRIKYNTKHTENPNSPRHLEHNTRRLEKVVALCNKLNETKQ